MEISCTQNAIVESQSKQGYYCDERIKAIRRRRKPSSLLWKVPIDGIDLTKIIILFLIMVGNVVDGANCPAKCSCQTADTAFCNHKGLRYIPTDFSPAIEKLYLFHNNITRIHPKAIANLKNLKLLDLSGNKISDTSLWKGIFSQLRLLENLMLQDNEIKSIPADMFKGLKNLARIYLQGNQISYISSGAFNNLPNLVELKLRNNKISTFPRLINTSNLLLLDLGHNMLRTLPDMMLSTVNLEHLMLQDNRLTQLRTSIFDDTSRLTQLDISKNRLTAVPKVIKSLTSLRALNMSLNRVRTIPPDTFTEMGDLKTLDIHGMGLKSLPRSALSSVIFNVLDISGNDWDCGCEMRWLPQYIGIFHQAFKNPNEVKCSSTSKLKTRTIGDLTADDFQCTDAELAKTLFPPKTTTATSATTTSSDPRRKWSPNPCVVYPCFHKGTCFLRDRKPACRCARNFAGPQCQISLLPPTTTTTTSTISTPRSIDSKLPARPELMINQDSVTEHSVEIILPQTDRELLVSVSEIGQDEHAKELRIKPVAHPFTVLGLESGKSYNICIHLPLSGSNDRKPHYIKERDTLCGSVRTEGISVVNKPVHNTDIQVVPSLDKPENPTEKGANDKDENGYKPGEGDKQFGNMDPDSTPTESSNFQIIYPALGAGIGAIIIIVLIVMFFICYRQKRKLKYKQNNPDYVPGSPVDTTQMVDMEMAPTMHLHQHNHYPAGWMEQNNGANSDKSHKNAKNKKQNNQSINYINNNQKGRKVSTPNRTSSPGSNSSSSNGGTMQTRYADTPLHYSPHQQYHPATPPIQMQYDVMPQQMNGRANEYVYRNHQNNNNSAMMPPGGQFVPHGRQYDHEVMDEMAPLVAGNMSHYNYGHLDNQMYPISQHNGPTYIAPSSAVSYPQVNARSAFQPIQSPRKNTVRTPTSESGPITTHVNTGQVLPTSTCLNRNMINDNMHRYPEGVPVV